MHCSSISVNYSIYQVAEEIRIWDDNEGGYHNCAHRVERSNRNIAGNASLREHSIQLENASFDLVHRSWEFNSEFKHQRRNNRVSSQSPGYFYADKDIIQVLQVVPVHTLEEHPREEELTKVLEVP